MQALSAPPTRGGRPRPPGCEQKGTERGARRPGARLSPGEGKLETGRGAVSLPAKPPQPCVLGGAAVRLHAPHLPAPRAHAVEGTRHDRRARRNDAPPGRSVRVDCGAARAGTEAQGGAVGGAPQPEKSSQHTPFKLEQPPAIVVKQRSTYNGRESAILTRGAGAPRLPCGSSRLRSRRRQTTTPRASILELRVQLHEDSTPCAFFLQERCSNVMSLTNQSEWLKPQPSSGGKQPPQSKSSKTAGARPTGCVEAVAPTQKPQRRVRTPVDTRVAHDTTRGAVAVRSSLQRLSASVCCGSAAEDKPCL